MVKRNILTLYKYNISTYKKKISEFENLVSDENNIIDTEDSLTPCRSFKKRSMLILNDDESISKDTQSIIPNLDLPTTPTPNIYYSQQIKYTTIPKIFKSFDKWPKKCNLNCLYCGCKILEVPIFIPTLVETIKKKKKNKEIINQTIKHTYGVFHHFACASKHINIMSISNEKKI